LLSLGFGISVVTENENKTTLVFEKIKTVKKENPEYQPLVLKELLADIG